MSALGEEGALPLGDASEIEAEAADWFQRRRFWHWSEEDQVRLDAWLDQSMAHSVAYWRLDAGFEGTERLTALRHPHFGTPNPAPKRNWRPILFRTAAAALVVSAMGAFALRYETPPPVEKAYATGIGRTERIALSDGSSIELNTNTKLRVSIGRKQRRVFLDRGEAYFQVAHDAQRPFVVMVGKRRITDLGTKFLVKSDPGRLKVSLVEGLARIEFANEPVKANGNLLKPGDVAIATADSISVSRAPERRLKDELAWRRGVLIFRDTTLAEAVAEFNRYNSQKLVIADADAAGRKIGGTFTTSGVERFAEVARLVLGLQVRERRNEIFISTDQHAE